MHISEKPEYEKETAMLIEEILRQRILGMKNEAGAYITPAFPKLLYVTDENNIYPDSPYYYLTELAAECVSKRMMPDFISAKKMREEHDGEVFPCMGCVEENEIITYKYYDKLYIESFGRMWKRLSKDFDVLPQRSRNDPNLFIKATNLTIYDTVEKDFVEVKKVIKNKNKNNWVKVKMSNGRILTCTKDHPFDTERGRVLAENLLADDIVKINTEQCIFQEDFTFSWEPSEAWAYGVLLTKGSLLQEPTVIVSNTDQEEIINPLIRIVENYYAVTGETKQIGEEQKNSYTEITFNSKEFQGKLVTLFEGLKKNNRHIPNELFSMNDKIKLKFLAGVFDGIGRINTEKEVNEGIVTISNKEVALQLMMLMQSLGMPAIIQEKENTDFKKTKYKIKCVPNAELLKEMYCNKKKGSLIAFISNCKKQDDSAVPAATAKVISVKNTFTKSDSYDVETESDHFEVSGIYSYNCRSFLGLYKGEDGKYKWYGRFNQGTVALNLVDVGLSAEKDLEMFWSILEERLGLCFQALMLRHERLKDTNPDVSPIHWRHGAISRTKKDNYNELLYDGYSSISLGYAGLYECVVSLIGESHTGENGKKLALEIMQYLRNTCERWKKETNIGFALYGTPLESTTDKLAKCLKRRFGIVPGVTDHDYVTNSYHVNVTEEISAEDKLKFESEFQAISSGGFISYIESCNLSSNIPAVISLIQYMYENIKYAEINGKFDHCQKCDFSGEILLDENNEWYCPNCNNRDHLTMNVARRTCGYIGDNFWNEGRTAEISERFVHVDNKELEF